MYSQIYPLINDPVSLNSFHLDMRLSNDPNLNQHAEDFNLKVQQMIKGSRQKDSNLNPLGNNYSNNHQNRNDRILGDNRATNDELPPSIGAELLGTERR